MQRAFDPGGPAMSARLRWIHGAPVTKGALAGLLPSPNHFRIFAAKLRMTCMRASLPPPSTRWPRRSRRKERFLRTLILAVFLGDRASQAEVTHAHQEQTGGSTRYGRGRRPLARPLFRSPGSRAARSSLRPRNQRQEAQAVTAPSRAGRPGPQLSGRCSSERSLGLLRRARAAALSRRDLTDVSVVSSRRIASYTASQ
jgi:hypothetical protein